NDYQPTTLYGYSSIILELSKYIIKHNLVVNQLQRVVSTTEKFESRDIIETAFGCPVYDQYGCREMPAIAIESEPGVMRVTDDVIALISNSKKQFLGTALHSYGFPLINSKIGDCGVIYTDNDTFDNVPFLILNLTISRVTDNFCNQDGSIISSSSISTYLSTLELRIIQHQIIQKNYKMFIVNYIPNFSFNL
ncbi:MAG: hypothetical protein GY822_32505, partial [Deltaproteobacteria bacterium]|nr:hypothetical protein [Deltaproteobacteria bacterium]